MEYGEEILKECSDRLQRIDEIPLGFSPPSRFSNIVTSKETFYDNMLYYFELRMFSDVFYEEEGKFVQVRDREVIRFSFDVTEILKCLEENDFIVMIGFEFKEYCSEATFRQEVVENFEQVLEESSECGEVENSVEIEDINAALPSTKVNFSELKIDTGKYDGEIFDFISTRSGSLTKSWLDDMIERIENGKAIHPVLVKRVLIEAIGIFRKEGNLKDITVKGHESIIVCGDTHGQFDDTLEFIRHVGEPSNSLKYLFNGDFVDRGNNSFGNIMLLLGYKILFPDSVFLNRGNHEITRINLKFGFFDEILRKYDVEMYTLFQELFHTLPLSSVINEKIWIAHGGIPRKAKNEKIPASLEDIRRNNKYLHYKRSVITMDILWNDPSDSVDTIDIKSKRTRKKFGETFVNEFLTVNNLDTVIRSHQIELMGYSKWFGGKLLTVFSAPRYFFKGNYGACLKIQENLPTRVIQFQDGRFGKEEKV